MPAGRTIFLIGTAVAATTGCIGGTADDKGGAPSSSAAITRQTPPPADLPSHPKGAPIEARIIATVTRDGSIADAVIDRSSGSKSLDDSALSTVRAARFGPLPAGVKDERVKVVVPIRFVLPH